VGKSRISRILLRMRLLKDPVAEPFFQIIEPFVGEMERYEHIWYGRSTSSPEAR
jgi:hypothetical protein